MTTLKTTEQAASKAIGHQTIGTDAAGTTKKQPQRRVQRQVPAPIGQLNTQEHPEEGDRKCLPRTFSYQKA